MKDTKRRIVTKNNQVIRVNRISMLGIYGKVDDLVFDDEDGNKFMTVKDVEYYLHEKILVEDDYEGAILKVTLPHETIFLKAEGLTLKTEGTRLTFNNISGSTQALFMIHEGVEYI